MYVYNPEHVDLYVYNIIIIELHWPVRGKEQGGGRGNLKSTPLVIARLVKDMPLILFATEPQQKQ